MIPDHAAWNIHSTVVELLHFLLSSSVFSILQFLGNFLRGIPGEALRLICPLIGLALVTTQSMHILNLFTLCSGSPRRTQNKKNFSEQNFHKKELVELFVPGLL